ncbi:MAG: GNVR domain-containing protein [Gammaproteobacteria bacterium]|jgi:uncharacterized protein involved in exopolysaccharide biosynthesis
MNTTTFQAYPTTANPQYGKSLADYIDIARRRRKAFIITALVVAIASILIAFLIPPIYKSASTILIEQQEIPQDLVRSTVTSYADQRVQVISQRVMTRPNLLEIIKQFNLYEEDRKKEPIEVVIEQMRDDIDLSMISAEVVDPRSGRPTQATIAFKLSYLNESPELAQKVAAKLTSLYLNENLKNRTVMAAEAAGFLTDEADRLSQRVSYLEKELAEFKERNLGSLPELTEMNLQLMERAERELFEVDRQISSIKERKIYLNSEVAQISPNLAIYSETGERILNPVDRLKTLESRLVSLVAVYSEDHPDIVRARKEIKALKAELGQDGNKGGSAVMVSNDMETRLAKVNEELETLRQRYGPTHPDVKRVEKEIQSLKASIDNETAASNSALEKKPDNPAYIQLQAQLNAADAELGSLQEKRIDLTRYEDRITRSPQVEREFRMLRRDYENAWQKYQEVTAKQMEAQMAKELESERKGERFTLIDPAILPEEPVSPNRKAIIIMGFIMAMGCGIGIMMLKENMDTSIHGSRNLGSLIQVGPLASIPYIETANDKSSKYGKRAVAAVVLLGIGIGALAAVHYFKTPLDVLWYVALRRFGIGA